MGRYGTASTRRTWSRSHGSLRGFTGLVRALRIGAALQRVPSVYWTCDEAAAADLRREVSQRHAAGLAGRWLSPRALQRTTGIDGIGGIITPGNAQIDPYRACLGIALGARAAGARLFENSPVRKVTGDRAGVHIELEHGAVRADWAVIATGYATAEFKPLAGRFRMSNTYVIATSADRCGHAPRNGTWRRDAVGDGQPVSLRAMDTRSAALLRWTGRTEGAALATRPV